MQSASDPETEVGGATINIARPAGMAFLVGVLLFVVLIYALLQRPPERAGARLRHNAIRSDTPSAARLPNEILGTLPGQ